MLSLGITCKKSQAQYQCQLKLRTTKFNTPSFDSKANDLNGYSCGSVGLIKARMSNQWSINRTQAKISMITDWSAAWRTFSFAITLCIWLSLLKKKLTEVCIIIPLYRLFCIRRLVLLMWYWAYTASDWTASSLLLSSFWQEYIIVPGTCQNGHHFFASHSIIWVHKAPQSQPSIWIKTTTVFFPRLLQHSGWTVKLAVGLLSLWVMQDLVYDLPSRAVY